jgi:hypothetical protein
LDKKSGYTLDITPEAEGNYFEVLENFYKHHSESSADRKSQELLSKAIALESSPLMGRVKENLKFLGRKHR